MVAVNAPGTEFVDRGAVDEGIGPVDQTAVGQGVAVGGLQVHRAGGDLAGGLIVQRGRRNIEVLAGLQRAAVGQDARRLEAGIMVGGQCAVVCGVGDELDYGIAEAEQLSGTGKAPGVDGEQRIGNQRAAGVGDGEGLAGGVEQW